MVLSNMIKASLMKPFRFISNRGCQGLSTFRVTWMRIGFENALKECSASKQCSSSKVSEIEEEVLKAEAEVRAAELALVMARAGTSATDLSGKWEASDIDEDAERIESGKVHTCIHTYHSSKQKFPKV